MLYAALEELRKATAADASGRLGDALLLYRGEIGLLGAAVLEERDPTRRALIASKVALALSITALPPSLSSTFTACLLTAPHCWGRHASTKGGLTRLHASCTQQQQQRRHRQQQQQQAPRWTMWLRGQSGVQHPLLMPAQRTESSKRAFHGCLPRPLLLLLPPPQGVVLVPATAMTGRLQRDLQS